MPRIICLLLHLQVRDSREDLYIVYVHQEKETGPSWAVLGVGSGI